MKSKTFTLVKRFILAVFTICVFLASCEMFTPPDAGDIPQDIFRSDRSVDLDRREEMVILHSSENRLRSESQLRDMVSQMLSSETATGQSRSSITGVYSYTVTIEDGFSSVTANRRPEAARNERSEIDFHVFYLDDGNEQGFALTCADDRIGNMIALVPNGDFRDTENPFRQVILSCLEMYIHETIDIYNSITEQEIAEVRTRITGGARSTTGWGEYDFKEKPIVDQLLTTKWNQRGWSDDYPYNNVINSAAGNSNPNLWPTGCVAVAMAQIAAYHQWPAKPPGIMLKPNSIHILNPYLIAGFNDPYKTTNKYTAFSSIHYNWDRMKYRYTTGKREAVPNANYLDNEYKMHVGVLMMDMGFTVSMKYTSSSGSASSEDVPGALSGMKFHSPSLRSYNFSDIKSSLDNSRPVYIRGHRSGGGHAWVVDGYRRASKEGVYKYFIHCNAGWGGSNNGWYLDQLFFNMNNDGYEPSRSGKPGVYDRNIDIIPNIHPNASASITPAVNNYAIQLAIPVPGALPITEVTATGSPHQYSGTVIWNVTGSNAPHIGVFRARTGYTATIYLTAMNGFTFYGVPENSFTVNSGVATVTNSANSGVVTVVFPPLFSGEGAGTQTDPYRITTVSQLDDIRLIPNAHFRLENNIDIQNIPWTPIPEFTGTLNGNNKIISNLRMTFSNGVHKTINYRDCISLGLFVHNKGTIQNLQVTANIDLTNIASNYSLPQDREIIMGVVTAINEGTINNTKVFTSSGSFMINSTIHVRTIVGGIAGYNDNNGNITSCTNNGTIYSSGSTGGIIGCNIGVTSGCINNGTIRYTYTNHNSSIGGIAGGCLMGFMLSGTNNGKISYTNASSSSQLIQPEMGHIAGSTSSAFIPANSFSFNSGTVNIGTLYTIGSHNQALYAGNRIIGRGYIMNGNVIVRVP